MSLGKRRPCTKLWATRPPWPCDQVLKLAVTDKGSPPSMKDGCQAAAIWDEEEMLVLAGIVGQGVLVGSRITIPSVGQGGVLEGASVGVLEGGSPTLCFFFARPEGGGGVLSLAGGC